MVASYGALHACIGKQIGYIVVVEIVLVSEKWITSARGKSLSPSPVLHVHTPLVALLTSTARASTAALFGPSSWKSSAPTSFLLSYLWPHLRARVCLHTLLCCFSSTRPSISHHIRGRECGGGTRWCSACVNWTPDRTLHRLNAHPCTRKMDHFRPWYLTSFQPARISI